MVRNVIGALSVSHCGSVVLVSYVKQRRHVGGGLRQVSNSCSRHVVCSIPVVPQGRYCQSCKLRKMLRGPKQEYVLLLYNLPHTNGSGSWNTPLRTYKSYVINNTDVGELMRLAARGFSNHGSYLVWSALSGPDKNEVKQNIRCQKVGGVVVMHT